MTDQPPEFAAAICWDCAEKRGGAFSTSSDRDELPCIICGSKTIGRNYETPRPEPAAPADSVPLILSRPDIGALREDLVAAMSTEMPTKLARDAVYGPDPHPGPWRWNVRLQGTGAIDEVTDATGGVIFFVDPTDGAGPTPRVRSLVEAAPEMEALLRDAFSSRGCPFLGSQAPGEPWVDYCGRCWACRTRALLDRIDRAK